MSADAKAHLRTIALLDIATTGSDEPPTDEALDQHLAELRLAATGATCSPAWRAWSYRPQEAG